MWCLLCFCRVPDSVEYYLDLLAALHSDHQHGVRLEALIATQNNLNIINDYIIFVQYSIFNIC